MIFVGLTALSVDISTNFSASYFIACGLECPEHIVLYCFIGAVLHERDVLVGCCVINDLRPVLFENRVHTPCISHGSYDHTQIHRRILAHKLLLNVIGVVFVYVKYNELLWVVRCYLTA